MTLLVVSPDYPTNAINLLDALSPGGPPGLLKAVVPSFMAQ